MSNRSLPPFPRYARLTAALGERMRAARLRRRLSATEMAERMGVSRATLHSLERGDLSIGLGVLVRALGILGLEDDLASLAADDELGRRLADGAVTPRRRRRPGST
jgi:transcriptional regulator with XRE-family HTH domain